MASKTTELTALAGADAVAADLICIVEASGPTSKKMQFDEFIIGMPVVISTTLSGSGAAATDEYMIWDAGVPKTISVLESVNAIWPGVATEMTGSGAAATDELLFSDAGVSKTITLAEFFATFPVAITTELTGAGTAGTDELLISDAGVPKTISVAELFTSLPVVLSTELDGSGVATTDEFIISDAGVMKTITMAEVIQAICTLGVALADVPEYADQAAAATGLSGTGKLWYQTATGLLGITIT